MRLIYIRARIYFIVTGIFELQTHNRNGFILQIFLFHVQFRVPPYSFSLVEQRQPAFGASQRFHISEQLFHSFGMRLFVSPDFKLNRIFSPVIFYAYVRSPGSRRKFPVNVPAAVEHAL